MVSRSGRGVVAAAVASMLLSSLVVVSGVAVATADEPEVAGTLESHELLSAALPVGTGAAERVVYRTLRTANRWGESSGSVFLPAGAPPIGGWPVISYAHGTLGSADQCAPSSTGFGPGEIEPIERWLGQGYAVVATDYSGLGTDGVLAYLDGHAAGANAVDIVQAAHELYGNVLSPRWMVVGLSEGGHATYFAGHEATSRATELDFRGSVVVAGPTHMEGLFPLGGPLFPDIGITGLVGYALYALAGIDDQRPEENIREVLSPQGIEWMEKARSLCAGDLGRQIRAERIQLGSLFSRSVWTPRMYDLFREMMQVPVDGYDRPLRVVQSLSDTTVPVALTWAQLFDMRTRGTQFEYQELNGITHGQTTVASMDQTMEFIDRLTR
ncbi:MAG: lipase family protein [Rhodococcus sp. (in: high G+C Gram-positive bacteria)]|uniref:alpha/beta hydrolase n=1 Tax=Rhodococcus sp. TaxID=1831 RepID=UPI002AD7F28C|nr:lipase family protein [Rhodococcus sp. (in: high G+C Gram-positive bacteria)]